MNLRVLCRAALVLFALAAVNSATAEEPPVYPMANVELGSHLDRITGIDFDPSRNWLVTAADDRTVRVWDAANGRLLKTVWVPRNERKDGELYALAVNPKTATAVVGGWTGYDWDGSMAIYVIDLESGAFRGRIEKFEERITSLAYSDDGSRLAVALLNGRILTLSVPEYAPLAESRACSGTAYRIDFGPKNRLVANCFDGRVRVYDANLKLQAEREILPGKRPGAVRFSPDGKVIAVGFFDSPEVHVVEAASLRTAYKPDTAAVAADMPLFAVEWSADGQTLYAAGDLKRGGRFRIIKWGAAGKGEPVEFDASSKRMLRLMALPDGSLAYTSMEHGVVVVNADGTQRFDAKPSIVDHQWRQSLLRVSEDGHTIAYGLDDDGTRFGVFSVDARRLGTTTDVGSAQNDREGNVGFDAKIGVQALPQQGPRLLPPIVEHPKIPVTDWRFSYEPKFNGQPIQLYGEQWSHSLAIEKNGRFFVLGLDSELRLYEADGSLRWSIYPSSGPYTAALSGDGRLVVAGHQDGTIRWYRAEDGKEVLAMFPHGNEEDWVAWTPSGHFMSSPNGDRYIGWHLNNGPRRAADFYSAWQFERLLYRPDIVQSYFRHRGEAPDTERAEGVFNVSELRESAPPDVNLSVKRGRDKDEANIEIEAEKRQRSINEYMVYVNSIPVTPYRERVLEGKERDGFQRTHKIPLFGTENEIRVEVFTDRSIQVQEAYVDTDKPPKTHRGDLYILAIGVNELTEMPQSSLEYAAQDAESVAAQLAGKAGRLYNRIHARVLSDLSGEPPTKSNIEEALAFLRQAGPNDTVLLFLAAHGLSNVAGDYFMVPRDATPDDVTKLATGSGKERDFDSLIRWDTFFEALREASGRRLLMVDTCQAQKIQGNFDAGSLAKRSAAASFALLAASKEDESSQEYPPGKHGLFTYALLDALNGSADDNRDGYVELSEMFDFTQEFVENNRLEKRLTQTPQLVAPQSLADMPLVTIQ